MEPALHAHVIPRYPWEPADRRRQPVWLHDWALAPRFDLREHEPLRDALAEHLG